MKIEIKSEAIKVRDPIARALADGQFRKRVIRDKTKYTRKAKHKGKVY